MNKLSPLVILSGRRSVLAVWIFLLCLNSFAQFPNPILFNTATNATGTGTIAVGMPDLNWTAALTNSLGPYVSAVSCGNVAPGNWATSPFPNTNWITYPHGCSASAAEHSCLGSTDEFYKLTVNLPSTSCGQSVATPSTYCLSLDFFADNWVHQIFVNGNIVLNNATANPYNSWGFLSSSKVTVTMCDFWQAGANEVIVHIKSGAPTFPGYSGFLAQANQTVNTTVGQGYSGAVSATNVSCFGGTNGSASVTINGSSAGSTFTWFPSGGNSALASGLSAGLYTVNASNGSCSFSQTVNISQPLLFNVVTSPNASLCPGGSVVLSASGASNYTWSTGASSSTVSVNSTGIYTVTGTNPSGCINSQTVSVSASSPPSINVAGSSSICIGSASTLTASGANSYTWSTGVQSPTLIVIPQAATTYTVYGNSSNNSCTGSATFAVNVSASPVLNISGNTPICNGSQVTLLANGAASYTWNTGNTTPSITVAPVTSMSYSVSGQNAAGCTGNAVVNVTVNNLPLVSANGSTVCIGQSGTLSASGAPSYTWSTGQIGSPVLVNSPGVYTVTGTDNATGCSNSATVQVINQPLPVINVSGNFTVCEGSSTYLTASGATSYTWSNGSTGTTVGFNPIVSTQHSVTGLDNSTSCANTQTFAILVYQKPQVVISGNQVLCGPGMVNLVASGADSYSWNTGSMNPSISVSTSFNQMYSVTGLSSVSGCTNNAVTEVTVSTVPIVIVNNVTVCAAHSTSLIAGGANSYQWSTGESGNMIVVNPLAAQVFTVTGYGTSTFCYDTKTVSISVLPAPILTINSPAAICKNKAATITVSGFNSFLWNTGDTTASIVVSPEYSTVYSVSSTQLSSGCVSTATVLVKVNPLPDVKIIGDRNACDGEYIILNAEGADNFLWLPGLPTNSLSVYVQENQLFLVQGTDEETGCENLDSIRVGTSPKCCEVFVPNTFTPDEDGLNDGFGAKSECKFKEFHLYVFDKWGEQVFVSDDIQHLWNGYYKGKLCQQDVYVYLIRAMRSETGIKPLFEKTGHILLLVK